LVSTATSTAPTYTLSLHDALPICAKGLSERAVVYRHALRNAMLPVLTVLGLQFGALLAGAIVTEKIFSWPGIGRLTIDAIGNREDRKSTRLNSSHSQISYAVFCLK